MRCWRPAPSRYRSCNVISGSCGVQQLLVTLLLAASTAHLLPRSAAQYSPLSDRDRDVEANTEDEVLAYIGDPIVEIVRLASDTSFDPDCLIPGADDSGVYVLTRNLTITLPVGGDEPADWYPILDFSRVLTTKLRIPAGITLQIDHVLIAHNGPQNSFSGGVVRYNIPFFDTRSQGMVLWVNTTALIPACPPLDIAVAILNAIMTPSNLQSMSVASKPMCIPPRKGGWIGEKCYATAFIFTDVVLAKRNVSLIPYAGLPPFFNFPLRFVNATVLCDQIITAACIAKMGLINCSELVLAQAPTTPPLPTALRPPLLPPSEQSEGDVLSIGEIAAAVGGTVGGVLLGVLMATAAFFYLRRRQQQAHKPEQLAHGKSNLELDSSYEHQGQKPCFETPRRKSIAEVCITLEGKADALHRGVSAVRMSRLSGRSEDPGGGGTSTTATSPDVGVGRASVRVRGLAGPSREASSKTLNLLDELSQKHFGGGGGGSQRDSKSSIEDINSGVLMATLVSQGSRFRDEQLELFEELGRGGSGMVYRGLWKGLPVAAKIMLLYEDRQELARRQMMEATMSAGLSHPNIVTTYMFDMKHLVNSDNTDLSRGLHRSPMLFRTIQLTIVQELCAGGTLGGFIRSDGFAALATSSETQLVYVLQIALDVAAGLEHLHSKNVVHMDLTPENVLLQAAGSTPRPAGLPWIAKVADFGLSIAFEEGRSHASHMFAGTPHYIAPETQLSGMVSKQSDIFTLGLLLHELFQNGGDTRTAADTSTSVESYRYSYGSQTCVYVASTSQHTPPLQPQQPQQQPPQQPQRQPVLGGGRGRLGGAANVLPPLPSTCPEEYQSLVMACLCQSPGSRPSITDVRQRLCEMVAQFAPEDWVCHAGGRRCG